MDDAKRLGEQQMLARWRQEYPEFAFQEFDTGKGTAVLMRDVGR